MLTQSQAKAFVETAFKSLEQATLDLRTQAEATTAERLKAMGEISELLGRHKVLLETCEVKERNISDLFAKADKELAQTVAATTLALEGKIKGMEDALTQRISEINETLTSNMATALDACEETTDKLGKTLKVSLEEKVSESIEALTKARASGIAEMGEMLGRMSVVAAEIKQEREAAAEGRQEGIADMSRVLGKIIEAAKEIEKQREAIDTIQLEMKQTQRLCPDGEVTVCK